MKINCLIPNSLKKINHIAFALLITNGFLISVFADELPLRAGDYILKGGYGHLSLKSEEGIDFTFFIHTDGANGHVCELDGKVRKGEVSLKGDDDKPCAISFRARSNGIDVTANDACNYYCGARAGFAGLYLVAARGCTPMEVRETRSQFKILYEKKDYRRAENTIKPLLSDCALTLNYIDSAWIRNDLALTQYQRKDLNACRNTLDPLADDALTYIGANASNVRPDVIPLVPVMKATLTNLKLCGSTKLEKLKQ